MRLNLCFLALLAVAVSGVGFADDLTAAQAESLLQPLMQDDCGPYYAEGKSDDFPDFDGSTICKYRVRVTKVTMGSGTATVEYNHDRVFDEAKATAWLADVARMESKGALSLLYIQLDKRMKAWAANGFIDTNYKPAEASFRLTPSGWQVAAAPQEEGHRPTQ